MDHGELTLTVARWEKSQRLARILYDRDMKDTPDEEKVIEIIAEVIYYGEVNFKHLQEKLRLYEKK